MSDPREPVATAMTTFMGMRVHARRFDADNHELTFDGDSSATTVQLGMTGAQQLIAALTSVLDGTDAATLRRAALHVAFSRGMREGIQGGSFTTRLIELIATADSANRCLIGAAFPEYVAAVQASNYKLLDIITPAVEAEDAA